MQTPDKLGFEDAKSIFYIDILHLIYQTWQKINILTKHKNAKQVLRKAVHAFYLYSETESINLSVNLAIKSLEAEVREHR